MTQEDRTSAPAQKRTSPAAMLAMSKALAKVAWQTNDANLKKQAAELNTTAFQADFQAAKAGLAS